MLLEKVPERVAASPPRRARWRRRGVNDANAARRRAVFRPCLRLVASLVGCVLMILARTASAEDGDDATLRLRSISIEGNESIPDRDLKKTMRTVTRSWYALWRARPDLDEKEIRADLETIERYYLARGYYETNARYELERDPDKALVDLRIEIEENIAVEVRDVRVLVDGTQLGEQELGLLAALPIAVGDRFTEEAYVAAEASLRNHYLESGHARVSVERKAMVDIHTQIARVTYEITPGPECVFGQAHITGNVDVETAIIERELLIEPGSPFRPAAIAEAQGRLLDLGLFGVVRIRIEEAGAAPEVVDLRVVVEERPPRAVTVGVGYGSEDEFRAQLAWSHKNWLGDGRQLSTRLKYSAIIITGGVTLVQPHFFSPRNRLIIDAGHDRLTEDTYLVNESRLRPRIERSIGSNLTLALGYRVAYVQISDVDRVTREDLGVRREGWLSGPAISLIHDNVDDELDPTRGGITTVGARQVGQWWGGDFAYYGLSAETRHYVALPLGFVFAARAEIETLDPFGSDDEVPIHERLYAGGDGSIRGYGRRRLGPRNEVDDPIGGLSLIESSIEFRRRIWSAIGAAVFLDAGYLSRDSYDFRFDAIEPAAGFGVTYATPVGPLRLDLGIPFDPPGNDGAWQIHFSVGHYF